MSAQATDPLQALAVLVVKHGVGLGRLPAAQQLLALAWVWAGLPADRTLAEREVNDSLKAQLAGAAAFLDTDHVELRRWLVDAGWLARDGYGRAYRRVAPQALPAAQRSIADALAGIDVAAWAANARRAHQSRREARFSAWQARPDAGSAA